MWVALQAWEAPPHAIGTGSNPPGPKILPREPWKHGRLALMPLGLVVTPLAQRSCLVNPGNMGGSPPCQLAW